MRNYTKSQMFLLLIKLGHYFIIFGHPWIKKYRVLLDIINHSIIFFLQYYTYSGMSLFSLLTILTKKNEIIPIVTYQDVFFNQIPKKSLIKKIDEFLKI